MLLDVSGLTKRFGGLTAVSDVSFGIGKGEIVGVIGPNGSGKTTLLSLISGSIAPTSGTVAWRSSEIQGRRPHEIAAAGVVKTFQNPQLFMELTVFEHLLIAGHLMLKRALGWRRIGTLLRAGGGNRRFRAGWPRRGRSCGCADWKRHAISARPVYPTARKKCSASRWP